MPQPWHRKTGGFGHDRGGLGTIGGGLDLTDNLEQNILHCTNHFNTWFGFREKKKM